MSERKHALIRGDGPGSWLMLTDDGRHLFHLVRYDEDGSAEYGDSGKPIRGSFWRAQLLQKDTGTRTTSTWSGDFPRTVELIRRGERRRIVGIEYDVVRAGEWDDWRSLATSRRQLIDELHDYTGWCDCAAPGPEDVDFPGECQVCCRPFRPAPPRPPRPSTPVGALLARRLR